MYLSFYNRLDQNINSEYQHADSQSQLSRAFIALKEDVQNLLNTERRMDNVALPELANSILDYGFTNLKNFSLLSDADHDYFCDAVEECLRRHEPRLSDISVAINKGKHFPPPDLTINFSVHATFSVDNESCSIVLQSNLSTLGGEILINDIRGSKDSPYGK